MERFFIKNVKSEVHDKLNQLAPEDALEIVIDWIINNQSKIKAVFKLIFSFFSKKANDGNTVSKTNV
jgi:hypothetical protein